MEGCVQTWGVLTFDAVGRYMVPSIVQQLRTIRQRSSERRGPVFSMRAKPPQDDGDIRAFLGEGTSFSGTLQFEGAVRVDGQFEGNVSGSDLLIVGETVAVLENIQIGSLVAGGGEYHGEDSGWSFYRRPKYPEPSKHQAWSCATERFSTAVVRCDRKQQRSCT